MSEIALVPARRARLSRLAEDGDRAAAIAVRLGEEPNRFLSTIQIGITSIGILSGIFGEAALAEPLAIWRQGLGMEQGPSEIGPTILEDMIGILTSKQLFNQTLKGEQVDLQKDLMAPVYVPESLTGMELLDQFRSSGSQMVFVVDEYGGVQGMGTLSDVIESVTGELLPHSTEESWAVQREDGSWLLDGLIPILELKDRL
jgi:CBS domain containing-hemolysin-like protein